MAYNIYTPLHYFLNSCACWEDVLKLLNWLLEGLISPYTLNNVHSLSFGTLVHMVEEHVNMQMEGRGEGTVFLDLLALN